MTNPCTACDAPTDNAEDDYDEHTGNRAEAAWERLCEDGPGPTLLEQQIAALAVRRGK